MRPMSTAVHPAPRGLKAAAVTLLLAAVALLGGCSSGGDSSGGDGMAYTGVDGERAEAAADAGGDSAAAAGEPRDVIVTGAMYVTVADPFAAAERATDIVTGAGGRIDARSETASNEWDRGEAWLTLRIPSDRLDAVVADLRGLGTVDAYSTDTTDVTDQVTDLEAQISTLRASTARIEALLDDAADIKDIITLEDELDSRQAELESLEARQRGLDDQVAMSTLDLTLTTEPAVIVDHTPTSFWDGLGSGWSALVGFLSGTLVVLGVLLPWLALGAVVTLAIVAAARARRGRRRRTAPSAAAPSADPAEPAPASSPQD